ncbi:hypothetical protein WISP_00753 [Willisornis vidua]|uniref:Uncharacterized protein n=1 Tax=Willisornis vidua TaxID=1566151 RepID=A0ABQ9DY79_9PASS|nr:hypothetical protein WISP_00753 [Willisornis vidua]
MRREAATGKDGLYTSARTLLAILRLATALVSHQYGPVWTSDTLVWTSDTPVPPSAPQCPPVSPARTRTLLAILRLAMALVSHQYKPVWTSDIPSAPSVAQYKPVSPCDTPSVTQYEPVSPSVPQCQPV